MSQQSEQETGLEALFADARRAEQYRDVERASGQAEHSVDVEGSEPAAGQDGESSDAAVSAGVSAGVEPVERVQEPQPDEFPGDAGSVRPDSSAAGSAAGPGAGPGAVVVHPALQGRVVGAELVEAAPAATAAEKESVVRRLLRRFGLGQTPPDPDELASEDFERIVRQATWTRSVNVAVVTSAGGDGSTPVSLMLSNTLGWIRGGDVATIEGTIAPGALARLAEGTPRRGLAEMLGAAGRVTSKGGLAGYSAPQTAHCNVFGSIGPREQLSDKDVRVVRELVDTYYSMTVTDADHNLLAEATQTVIDTADAVVIPCVRHPQSLFEAWRTFETVAAARPDLVDASGQTVPRVMFVLGSDGPGEDPVWATSSAGWLRKELDQRAMRTATSAPAAPAALIQQVPFEPVMKSGAEITYAQCTRASLAAWRRVAAGVVLGLLDAPEDVRPALSSSAI